MRVLFVTRCLMYTCTFVILVSITTIGNFSCELVHKQFQFHSTFKFIPHVKIKKTHGDGFPGFNLL